MLEAVMTWLLAALFTVGAVINALGPRRIREDYARWGYPKSFRFVTAVLELTVATLLLFPGARFAGALLGATIMAAAVATTVRYREPGRSIAPLTVLIWACAVGWMASPNN